MGVPPYDLRERTRLFALAVVKFCRRLPNTDEAREAARQLRRAANSVRSNYRASRNGRSRDEFASRLAEAYKKPTSAAIGSNTSPTRRFAHVRNWWKKLAR